MCSMTVFFDKIKSNIQKYKNNIILGTKNALVFISLIILLIYTFNNSSIYSKIVYLSNNIQNINVMPTTTEIIKRIQNLELWDLYYLHVLAHLQHFI